jgi:5,10-methylenetetrahydromethanopterin reductase
MKIGVYAYGPGMGLGKGLDDLTERFAKLDADGFHTAWAANPGQIDQFTLMSLMGRVTTRMELGTAVLRTYPYHPLAMAQHALTAQAASNNRFILGVGPANRSYVEDVLGITFKPIRHMMEYLTILNGLFSGEMVDFKGQEYHLKAKVQINGANKPLVILSALGPQMLRLAGRMADGTITWMGGPKYLETMAIPIIYKGAEASGRPTPRIIVSNPICVTNAFDSARESANRYFGHYGKIPSYRALLDIEGVSDASAVAIVGDEAQVERQLRHLASIGVTDLNASPYPVKEDPEARERTYRFLSDLAKAGGI